MFLLILACSDQSLKIIPSNEPPIVEILSPLPNQSFVHGVDVVQVCGEGSDAEDGVILPGWELDAAAVAFSTVEGCGDTSGGGTLADLAVGVYTLTAIAEDSGGEVAVDEVIFSVVASDAPLVEITAPVDGAVWLVGEEGTLMATVADDGTLPTVARWNTDVDGALGESEVALDGSTQWRVQFASPGMRVLSATVVDSDGQEDQDSIQLQVCADADHDGLGDCEDTEDCDGIDNDGNGTIDDGFSDTDRDGIADCMDMEACDGLDNDGDGVVDDGFSDTDRDGLADCMETEDCDGLDNDGDGGVDEGFSDSDRDGLADCMDIEDCDGLDNDGDSLIDEGFSDSDRDGLADCVDSETCDGLDNDGDSLIDEDFSDTDGDGIADCMDSESCDGLDNDGDSLIDEGFSDTDVDGIADCMDIEDCDGLDNDGDGGVDEGFSDTDVDGIADCVDLESCDGQDNDGDGLIDEGFSDTDGDGTVDCMDIESCDGVDNDGNGLVDEGFPDTDLDGIADCMEPPSSSCASYGGGNSALGNPDFETGTSSSWTFDSMVSISSFVHGGSYAAEANGNHYIEQRFASVSVSSLVKASFWTWHDAADYPAMYVEWGYSDGSYGSSILVNAQLSGWVEVNMLPSMNRGKALNRILVYGYSGGGSIADITRFDDFLICY